MHRLTVVTCTLLVLTIVVSASTSPVSPDPKGIEAITRPSDDRTLAFVRSGMIAKIFVEDGDWIEANQPLIKLDDAAEQVQLEQLRAEAEDQTQVKAAQAQFDQSKVDLKRKEEARRAGAATILEVEHARLEALIQELRLQLRHFERKQNFRKVREAEITISRMKITSPIAGRIEGLAVKEGEAREPLEKIIRVVKIDPLWIEVPTPLRQARKLKEGGRAKVLFQIDDNRTKTVDAIIKLIRSEADAASDTLKIRIEVPNPSHRPAGEHIRVVFPSTEKDS